MLSSVWEIMSSSVRFEKDTFIIRFVEMESVLAD